MLIKIRIQAVSFVFIGALVLSACGNNSTIDNKSTIIIAKTSAKQSTNTEPKWEFQKGVIYTAWWQGEYSTAESDGVLANVISPMGVNWVSIVVSCYHESITSTEIKCLPNTKTSTDADLYHVISQAHQLGLQVMLKPHIDISNDNFHWRGEIDFGENDLAWKAWFASYEEFIAHYATVAQTAHVEYFVIGTELAGTSRRSHQWRSVVKTIRKIYSGPITYASNWDEVSNITWWDAVDSIGVDGYYPLTKSDQPTITELKIAWEPIVSELGKMSEFWDRPIILTEIGYRSLNGTNQHSFDADNSGTVDLQEQADCYQAVFEAFYGQPWWQGVFWWNWTVSPFQGGPNDDGYTANNKPAENILRLNYGAQPRNIPNPSSLVE